MKFLSFIYFLTLSKLLLVIRKGIRKKAQEIQKYNGCPHLLSRGSYELLEKKTNGGKKEDTRTTSIIY